MEKKIHMRFVYIIEGHVAAGNVDTYFYSHLPDVKTEVLDTHTGRPVTDIPPVEQTVTVIGSTFSSSAAVAEVIKEYLRTRRRKIKISIAGTSKHVEHEGPDIKLDAAELGAMIDRLADEGGENYLEITATY